MDFERARHNMIEQQIRPWEVLDTRLLETLERLPRHEFVAPQFRSLAYCDTRIPLGHGEVMMNPNVEARMLQALQAQPDERVLEIGTGSGYVTACLAALAGAVDSVEIHPDLSQTAGERLAAHGVDNAALLTGDAAQGWPADRRYDVIAITGSVPEIARAFCDALAPGGRLFAICGTPSQPIMEAVLVRRSRERDWVRESLFETELPPLVNAATAPAFEF